MNSVISRCEDEISTLGYVIVLHNISGEWGVKTQGAQPSRSSCNSKYISDSWSAYYMLS